MEGKGHGRENTAGIVPSNHRRLDKWLSGAAQGRRAFLKLLSLLQEDLAGAEAGAGVQSARGRTNTRMCNIWRDTHEAQTSHMGTHCCQIHFSHAFLWLFFVSHGLLQKCWVSILHIPGPAPTPTSLSAGQSEHFLDASIP